MAKRAHIEVNSCSELRDPINMLPDELLVRILSFLSLKEAVATSIVCLRWRYLWTFTNKLIFDGVDFFRRVWSRSEHSMKVHGFASIFYLCESWKGPQIPEESLNYIAWVNNVLGSHKCSSIDEFGLDFFLSESHKKHIDGWLRFASARKVQSLELKLKPCLSSCERYIFPRELLIHFKHLRTMRLQWVRLSGEDLELILRTCPLLEELSVCASIELAAIKIIGPSPELKRLVLNDCRNITSVEIHDANLVFLMCNGMRLQQFVLKNVPHLVEMHLGKDIIRHIKDFLLMFSSYLPQLEKLTLDTLSRWCFDTEEAMMLCNSVKMSNLKQLVVKYFEETDDLLILTMLTYFIRASPLLQSLVLEAYCGDNEVDHSNYFVDKLPDTVEVMGSHRYPHLKRVEIVGCRGLSSQLDLVVHLLNNGTALEEVIIDLRKRDNSWMIFDSFMPNSVTGLFPVGYPCGQDQINALKANVKDQLTKRLHSPLRFNLKIL